MRQLLCGLLLAVGTLGFAQQPPPSSLPPHATPPTFPQGQAPRPDMPPDTKAPPPQKAASADIGQQMQDKLDAEPELAKCNVRANVNDTAVVLTGTVTMNSSMNWHFASRSPMPEAERSWTGSR